MASRIGNPIGIVRSSLIHSIRFISPGFNPSNRPSNSNVNLHPHPPTIIPKPPRPPLRSENGSPRTYSIIPPYSILINPPYPHPPIILIPHPPPANRSSKPSSTHRFDPMRSIDTSIERSNVRYASYTILPTSTYPGAVSNRSVPSASLRSNESIQRLRK